MAFLAPRLFLDRSALLYLRLCRFANFESLTGTENAGQGKVKFEHHVSYRLRLLNLYSDFVWTGICHIVMR